MGHQVVALIAERHLNPHARAAVTEILASSLIDPGLPRCCGHSESDVFVDASTWADDERSIDPKTAGWHFLDVPRGAPKGDIAQYCPPEAGCVTRAITDQLALLCDSGASTKARPDALRYVIHFIGDLHQPLHTTTNNDRGGNCVPVGFFGRTPVETNPAKEDFKPNLHGVWDTDIIEHYAHGRTAQQIADELDSEFKAQISGWGARQVDLAAWI